MGNQRIEGHYLFDAHGNRWLIVEWQVTMHHGDGLYAPPRRGEFVMRGVLCPEGSEDSLAVKDGKVGVRDLTRKLLTENK